jgi:hypothetical protein
MEIAEGWGLHHLPDTAKGYARELLAALTPPAQAPAIPDHPVEWTPVAEQFDEGAQAPAIQAPEAVAREYFCFTSDNGLELFDNEEAARSSAQNEVDYLRKEAERDGEWSESIDAVRWGVVLGKSMAVPHHDEKNDAGEESFDYALTTAQVALHPATADLMARFAHALTMKLAAAEVKYGYSDGWRSPDWLDECRAKLLEHVAKGDPRDVAAYCAFLWHHGWSATPTARASVIPAPTDEQIQTVAARYTKGVGHFDFERSDFMRFARELIALGEGK